MDIDRKILEEKELAVAAAGLAVLAELAVLG
jgi:hypothetical protein